MTIVAIIQARCNSKRFSNKILKKINNEYSLIEVLLKRVAKSKKIDKIFVATTKNKTDDKLVNILKKNKIYTYRGSEEDVLDRYYKIGLKTKAKYIIRLTADNPLIDHKIIDELIKFFLRKKLDFANNVSPPTYPDGMDVEIMKMSVLKKVWENAKLISEREHVTKYIYNNSNDFKQGNLAYKQDYSKIRLTVDYPKDLKVVKNVFNFFQPNYFFCLNDIIKLYKTNPTLFTPNKKFTRNEGSKINSGQKLWNRAQNCISGGNMLFSKKPDLYLPGKWPTYFSKTKSCYVWDLDKNKYTDVSMMGVGTNILGYSHPEVDDAVRSVVKSGNISTLNCPEEVFLAEKLISMHKWSKMVKFARSGGEANAIAIRIARAASGRDKIAICGYHGWHDWYLASNLTSKNNLNSHLLKGLETNGVPKKLYNTAIPFQYNDFDALEKIIKKNKDIGVIKMEVRRNQEPKDNFLEKVSEIAKKNKIVLIFDECTTGFREQYGGLHKKYKVEPDICIFGKALGNGYAITAVIGKKEIMKFAKTTFISSTFWTERIGFAAGLATLEVMEKNKSWKKITKTGKEIKKRWIKLSNKYDLKIEIFGLDAIAGFNFLSKNNLAYRTLIVQEMLSMGFLANNLVYVCTEHNEDILNEYFYKLEKVFKLIKSCEEGNDIKNLLNTPIIESTFKRLN